MPDIFRKPGWTLNPNDRIVNSILKKCVANGGHCPCHNESEDDMCPCSDYVKNDVCHCGLYVKSN